MGLPSFCCSLPQCSCLITHCNCICTSFPSFEKLFYYNKKRMKKFLRKLLQLELDKEEQFYYWAIIYPTIINRNTQLGRLLPTGSSTGRHSHSGTRGPNMSPGLLDIQFLGGGIVYLWFPHILWSRGWSFLVTKN